MLRPFCLWGRQGCSSTNVSITVHMNSIDRFTNKFQSITVLAWQPTLNVPDPVV